MRTTITIRAEKELREALEARAQARGRSLSALIREILSAAVLAEPLGERIAHLRGALGEHERPLDDWQERIRRRNIRP